MNKLFPCQGCTMQFNMSQPSCPYCDFPSPSVLGRPQKSKYNCPKCSFQNDLSNEICVACQANLYDVGDQKQKCKHCGEMVLGQRISVHEKDCLLSLQLIRQHQRQIQEFNKSYINCKYCSISIPSSLIHEHNQVCLKKPVPVPKPPIIKPSPVIRPPPPIVKPYFGGIMRPGGGLKPLPKPGPVQVFHQPYEQIIIPKQINQNQLFEQNQLKRLTKLQRDAIMYMQAKSLKQHKNVQRQLQERILKLGFKKTDLENLLFYIENYAPIIIHIHITKHMEFFVKDTHYRNQFQTGKSSGTLSRDTRTQWENRMFDNKYSKATDHQRVKYGVINFTNDPKGVSCALSYGQSYFLLKQHVRNRCTMTDMDSSNATSVMGTFKFCFHILNKMNDNQLKSAFKAAKALEQSSSVTTSYKQIQIHGPVQFAKDIQRMYVNKKQVQNKTYLDMVYKFCEKNKIEYQFI